MYDRNHPNYPGRRPVYSDDVDPASQDDILNDHFDALIGAARTAILAKEAPLTSREFFDLLAEVIDDQFHTQFDLYECHPADYTHDTAFKRAEHELAVEKARAVA